MGRGVGGDQRFDFGYYELTGIVSGVSLQYEEGEYIETCFFIKQSRLMAGFFCFSDKVI